MTDTAAPAAESGTDAAVREVDVAIVGAGFAGLGMAIRLKRDGIDDFVVFERHDDVGGTWHVNTYPGCGCDVPSHLYSFSFALNPDWSNTFSKQPEIKRYIRRVAEEFGVMPHIRLGHTVAEARFDEATSRWTIETDRGTYRARAVVAAIGGLSEPRIPDLPGLESFEGEVFHSAEWNHDYDVSGKRIASIGTGASAIQYVPAIQPKVERLVVFQRTPPWVVPHNGRRITRVERVLFRAFPPLQKLARALIYVGRELLVPGFTRRPALMSVPERLARRHLEKQVPDPELRARLTPDYKLGCKRILPSNDWYPALTKPNVDVVTAAVTEVRPNAVVDVQGNEHEVDAIVLGTGFEVTEFPGAQRIHGRGGRSLGEVWGASPHAYLGTVTPGFPNLFFLAGPNTGTGHTSMVYMLESQIEFVRQALRAASARGADTVEVRPEAEEAYNREVDRRMGNTVWSSGCSSWYIDETGRNSTLWPDWTWDFRRRASRFEPAHFEIGGAAATAETAAPAGTLA